MISMKPGMVAAQRQLLQLLEKHPVTAGMYVRVHGDNLIVGRHAKEEDGTTDEADDRVRLTRLAPTRFGVSVKRHTGRWERTPFSGAMPDVVDSIVDVVRFCEEVEAFGSANTISSYEIIRCVNLFWLLALQEDQRVSDPAIGVPSSA